MIDTTELFHTIIIKQQDYIKELVDKIITLTNDYNKVINQLNGSRYVDMVGNMDTDGTDNLNESINMKSYK